MTIISIKQYSRQLVALPPHLKVPNEPALVGVSVLELVSLESDDYGALQHREGFGLPSLRAALR